MLQDRLSGRYLFQRKITRKSESFGSRGINSPPINTNATSTITQATAPVPEISKKLFSTNIRNATAFLSTTRSSKSTLQPDRTRIKVDTDLLD